MLATGEVGLSHVKIELNSNSKVSVLEMVARIARTRLRMIGSVCQLMCRIIKRATITAGVIDIFESEAI